MTRQRITELKTYYDDHVTDNTSEPCGNHEGQAATASFGMTQVWAVKGNLLCR